MVDLVRSPAIDEILGARREVARGQDVSFEGYCNHAHRIHNFVRTIASLSPEDEEKIAIAAAVHDLCAFNGLDYLEPSIEEAAPMPSFRSATSSRSGRQGGGWLGRPATPCAPNRSSAAPRRCGAPVAVRLAS